MGFHSDFVAGATDISPLLPAGIIVGVVTGVAAMAIGLPPIQAIVMSLIVYYPSVMLTAFVLLEAETPGFIIVITALVVGSRSVMYSLSLAPHFTRLSTRWKWLLAYFLWTPVYALSIERYVTKPTTSKRGYYLGTAVPLWVTIQLSVIAGVVFGQEVPPGWQLDFVISLAFIALLMRFLKDLPTKAAALVAGLLAVIGSDVPLSLGLIIAATGGTVVGLLIRKRGTS